ncbi:MAG: hypothetical protein JW909_09790, partial [Planctomycetes bacterium]|nr:hypothetical protein [Planctomycetota bacterium]
LLSYLGMGRFLLAPWGIAGMTAAWLAWALLGAWISRPGHVEALAYWDETAARNEKYVSAYWFEGGEQPEAGELIHMARAARSLDADLAGLAKDIPAAFPGMAVIAPLLLVMVAVSGILTFSDGAAQDELTAAALRRARTTAQELADKSSALDALQGLSDQEKASVEKLKSSLQEITRWMEDSEGKTSRDVLEELDRRAREAEKLAEAMEALEKAALSSAMIAELERHADTADLGTALRASALEKISVESEKIADRLRDRNLTIEAAKRLEYALEQAMNAASDEDRESLAGRHLDAAHRELQNERRLLAAEEFSQLARRFAQAEQRQQARRQLERLAENLRNSGQQIFGNDGLRRLRQSRYAGMQQLTPRQLNIYRAFQQRGMNPGGSPMQLGQMTPMPGTPGAPTAPPGQMPYGTAQGTPIPGSMQGGIPGAMQGGVPGGVPGGMAQGMTPGGMGMGAGAAAGAVPGGPGGGVGGLEAGVGSAAYASSLTDRMAPGHTGVVNAEIGRNGESMAYNLDGQGHAENARRSKSEIAVDFIKAEEEALAAEPLPLARREQVLRYFTALRRQLENEH